MIYFTLFFQISLVLLIGSNFSALSFCLNFSISTTLRETVIHCDLEELFFFLVRVSLCGLCESNTFGTRVIFVMIA